MISGFNNAEEKVKLFRKIEIRMKESTKLKFLRRKWNTASERNDKKGEEIVEDEFSNLKIAAEN